EVNRRASPRTLPAVHGWACAPMPRPGHGAALLSRVRSRKSGDWSRRHRDDGGPTMSLAAPFPAFRIHNDEAGYRSGIEQVTLDDLSPGEVVVKAAWSSVNYKDALAGTGKGKILRRFPLVGGIDVAGHVVASTDPKFREGDEVLVTGCGLSETRDGGYSAYVRLPAEWVVALPRGLDLRQSMVLGTAGFTAALALYRMRENRQRPELGPLAVTGATGAVGSMPGAIFSKAGYEVHAVSGRADQAGSLRSLAASHGRGREPVAGRADGGASRAARGVAPGQRFGRQGARHPRRRPGAAGGRVEAGTAGRRRHRRGHPGGAAAGVRTHAGRAVAGPHGGADRVRARRGRPVRYPPRRTASGGRRRDPPGPSAAPRAYCGASSSG